MAEKECSIIISLSHMVDLALGSPEVGAVNFNVLHSLLHVMIQQMNLMKTHVEFRGQDCERIKTVLQTSSSSPTLKLSEYFISEMDSAGNLTKPSKGKRHSKEEIKTVKKTEGKSDEKHEGKTTVSSKEQTKKEDKKEDQGKQKEDKKEDQAKQKEDKNEDQAKQKEDKIEDHGKEKEDKKEKERPERKETEKTDEGERKRPGKEDNVKTDEQKKKKEDVSTKESVGKKESVVLVQHADGNEKQEKVIEREVDKSKPTKTQISHKDLEKVDKKLNELEKEVQEIKSISSNEVLINRSRSQSQTTPVNDMWQIMNLTKRMDATEECVNKLTSMVEDLAKDTGTPTTTTDGGKPPKKEPGIFDRLDNLEKRVSSLEHNKSIPPSAPSTIPAQGSPPKKTEPAPDYQNMTTDQIIVTLRNELGLVRQEVDNIGEQIHQVTSVTDRIPFQAFMDGIKEIDELRSKFEAFAEVMKEKTSVTELEQERASAEPPQDRFRELEERLNLCTGQMEGMDVNIATQMENLQQQIAELEKELGETLEKVNAGTPMGDTFSQDFAGLSDLYNKIQIIQGDMENLNQTATRLMDDREERQLHIEALLEQIETLKTLKADREDLEDALADKADHNVVNRKVSHDQFDAACDDLSRGLEEALAKLTQQETLWQQALDDVQREIENKLDKIEISPLKDFVNSKLKALHERLKIIANMRKESEAAGTKLKLLRNVNCISCDSDVVMKTQLDTPSIPAPDPLPPSRSMRPYLTYELDQVRKQQRRPQGKNMLFMEEVERQRDGNKLRDKEILSQDSRAVDHLCNRYCGGSHTTTNAQQRVTRMGHFLTQWGPEAIQLTEGTVRGTDGQMYRARAMPPQSAGKGKRSSKAESSPTVQSPKKRSLQTSSPLATPTSEIPSAPSPPTIPAATTSPQHKSSALAMPSSPGRKSPPGTSSPPQSTSAKPGSSADITPSTQRSSTEKRPSSSSKQRVSSAAKKSSAQGFPKQRGSAALSPTKTGSIEKAPPGSPLKSSSTEEAVTGSPLKSSSIDEAVTGSPLKSSSIDETVTGSPLKSSSTDEAVTGSPLKSSSIDKAVTGSPLKSSSTNKAVTGSPRQIGSIGSPGHKGSAAEVIPDSTEPQEPVEELPADAPEPENSVEKSPSKSPEQKQSSTEAPEDSTE